MSIPFLTNTVIFYTIINDKIYWLFYLVNIPVLFSKTYIGLNNLS